MPKITVIIPVYNTEEFLKDCLDSLVEQTEKDIEIIAIDDASTDHSLEILEEYAKIYSNIRVISNEKNIGVSETRNKGIELAEGEYITFVDSDDYINPNMYKELYEVAQKYNHPDLITTGFIFVKGNEYRSNNLNYIENAIPEVINPLENPDRVYEQSPAVWNKLFRKVQVKDYKFLKDCIWEDIAFSFTRFLEAKTVVHVPTSNYFYRRSQTKGLSSINYQENDRISDIFRIADELEEELKRNGKYKFFQEQIRLLQIAICLQRVNEVNEWKIEEERKNAVKNTMYATIYQKYGDLEGLDNIQLQIKVGINTTEEYSSYIETEKERPKRKHLLLDNPKKETNY